MANVKITQVTETTAPETNALLIMATAPDAATPLSRSVSVLNLIGTGWVKSKDTWTYASPTTITVPSGATGIYSVGDNIKLTQTTVKYFYVVGVADTVLTVTGGSDYAVANAAITSPYYSKTVTPTGFPRTGFSLGTPTWTTSGTAFTNQPINNNFRFHINSGLCTITGKAQCHATSGGTGMFTATFTTGYLPAMGVSSSGPALNFNTLVGGASNINASDVMRFTKYDGTAIATNSEYFGGVLTFRF